VSRRIKLALMGVGILAIGLAVFFLVLNPMRGDISELQAQIEDEQTKIQSAKVELAAAEETRTEGRRNQARLMELAKMIPQDPEIPSLILQIQDLANKAGIEWIQVSFSDVRTAEGSTIGTIPISLQFTGTFYDVTDFIYRAEQMASGPGRLLTVKDVSLAPNATGSGSVSPDLSVNMTIYAFSVVTAPAAQ
jgi:type IV pilus assembly protein PilO